MGSFINFYFVMHMVNDLVSGVLFGVMGLISIINPVGMAFVFLDRTVMLSKDERKVLAKRVAIYSLFVLLAAFFLGTPVLHFFGISIEALRIGGGLAVAVSGWKMLNAPDKPISVKSSENEPKQLMEQAFFPLTMPLTIGPGAVATAIALSAGNIHKLSKFVLSSINSIAITVLVALVIYFVYSQATLLARYFGSEGTKIAVRISAFLLLCVGVQILLTGLAGFISSLESLN